MDSLVAAACIVAAVTATGCGDGNTDAAYIEIVKAHFREHAKAYAKAIGVPLAVTNEKVHFGCARLAAEDELVAEARRDLTSNHFRDDAIYVKCQIAGPEATRACYVVLRNKGGGRLGVMNTLIPDPKGRSAWHVHYFRGTWLGLTKAMLERFRTEGPD
ncbi:MAG: hypothetical protein HQ582_18525 [Planctomycetes bacterium]|nr:hypothetical protein [Planctomycetota bacterium]